MAQWQRQNYNLKIPEDTNTYSLVISFAGSFIDLSEETQLTSLPDFISAVGGNLGLFIGFSVMPVLLKTVEFFWHFQLRSSFMS